jgi:hypothetical protein
MSTIGGSGSISGLDPKRMSGSVDVPGISGANLGRKIRIKQIFSFLFEYN